VNAIIDREALLSTFDPTRGSAFVPMSHAFPDVAVGGLLRDYVPDGIGTSGDVEGARDFMAQSTYDSDGDGMCDGDACSVIANRFRGTTDEALDIVEGGLAELGIRVEWVDEPQMVDPMGQVDPAAQVGLTAIIGWVIDYPSGNDFVIQMSDSGPGGANPSLLGATPEQLGEWGYAADSVPSLDDKIALCRTRSGSAAFGCWAELDQLLTEQVVAWVPVASSLAAYVTGDRIDKFDISGSEAMPALDRISLYPEPAR
jgi:hypothetical protein